MDALSREGFLDITVVHELQMNRCDVSVTLTLDRARQECPSVGYFHVSLTLSAIYLIYEESSSE